MSGGISDLSDADLLKALGQDAPAAGADLSGFSDADLMRQLGQPAQSPSVPPKTWGETAADVGRSVGGGLSKGVAGLAGLPADAANIITQVYDRAEARLTNQPYEQVKATHDAGAPVSTDALARYGGDALNKAYGYDYKPETTAGKFADSVASFVPGALLGPGSVMRRFALGAGVPGLASEAAGQATAGTSAEPYARVAAALASPAIAGRVVTPLGVPVARAPLVATLDQEGVPLTAGQRTGNAPLQWMETMLSEAPLSGGGAARAMEQQRQGLNRAVARRFGEDADTLTPDVMAAATDRIGGAFRDVSSRNALQFDPQMGQDMADVINRYGRKLPSQTREAFGNTVQDLRDQVIAGGGQIPGEVYQQARSDLSKIAQGARVNDPAYSAAMGGLRDALDGAFERSIAGTPDAGRLAEARQQWAGLKTAEKAMNVPGVVAAEGNISPNALRSTVSRRDPAAYSRGDGDMAALARAATAIAPLPNSGTNPRSMAASLLTALGSVGTGLAMHAPNEQAAMMGLGGLLAPAAVGRTLMSRPAQAYLGNNVIAPLGGGAPAAGARAVQGYEDAQADPLMLRVRPRP